MSEPLTITDKGAEEFALEMLLFNISEYREHKRYIQNHYDSPEKWKHMAQLRSINQFFRSKMCQLCLDIIGTDMTGEKIIEQLKSENHKEEQRNA